MSVQEVTMHGLEAVRIWRHDQAAMSEEKKKLYFHKHFGSSPLDLADMWYDLVSTDIPGAALTDREKTLWGFKRFMMAHYYIWSYTRNAEMLATAFMMNERYCRGRHLWDWIGKIAALKEKKIKWPDNLSSNDPDLFLISIDGTDLKTYEPKHPTMPIDKGMASNKFGNKAAWKYEVALLVHEPKVVWISGPHRGGKSDLTIWREGLKLKLAQLPGSMASVDLGYRTSEQDEVDLLAWPNSLDAWDSRDYKSRIRCRQETFFGRIKKFRILSETFRHTKEKHKDAFEAVCVTVQYQMDNGSPIYHV